MKIISEEEKNEHKYAVLKEGLKGCAIGAVIGYGLSQLIKYKHPARFASFNASVKASLYVMPAITVGAFMADDGSVKFDEKKYRSDYLKQKDEEALQKFELMTTSEKFIHNLNENKYKYIVSAWAASLYGSWKIVSRDKYMTNAQKIVQARVYAQAITVVLLLGTILLSMRDAELKKKQPVQEPEWKRYLDEQERLKKEEQHAH